MQKNELPWSKSAINAELRRKSFIHFCQHIRPDFITNWHHQLVADALEKVADGQIKRLMIFQPPRTSKSMMVSELFPAWVHGKTKNIFTIQASYGAELAEGFGATVKANINDPSYTETFGDVLIPHECSMKSDFKIYCKSDYSRGKKNIHGRHVTCGAGGATTGKGAHILIIDDPVKNHEEAYSKSNKDLKHNWYKTTIRTRLQSDARMIVMQTRWADDDLAGRILKEEGDEKNGGRWKVISLPAILDCEPCEGDHRKQGEALFPQFFNEEYYREERTIQGARFWESLYQQRPTALTGNLVNRSWFKYYRELPRKDKFDLFIQSWDLAFRGDTTSDYVVGQCWGKYAGQFYLVDQVRDRMTFTQTLDAMRSFSNKHPYATAKYVEEKANGSALIDSLKHEIHGIIPVTPDKDKVTRLILVSPTIEAGNVFIPENCAWAHDFIEEMVSFPSAANDDQVDAATQALAKLIDTVKKSEMYSKISSFMRT